MKKAKINYSASKSSTLASCAFAAKASKITFEEEASIEGTSFCDHVILLYGQPKIGKSTVASLMPGVYMLPTEPGYKHLKVRKTPITNWKTFINFVTWAEENKDKVATVKMWCIDTVDNLSEMCMQYVCGREDISHPSDADWGAGWKAFKDELAHWLLRLMSIGPGTMFITHVQEREVVTKGIKLPKMTPSMPKSAYTLLNNQADIILYFTSERIKTKEGSRVERVIYTKPEPTYDAGDRTGQLPDKIVVKNEKELVKQLSSYFK